ncbi:hypothetical protein AB0D54_26305 [Streptomyces xanthophaeus]|uniref:hypothetical protein n=1 Tax=Streptomyces xanthophaeus TaxID=67385 RepID=UPI0034432966
MTVSVRPAGAGDGGFGEARGGFGPPVPGDGRGGGALAVGVVGPVGVVGLGASAGRRASRENPAPSPPASDTITWSTKRSANCHSMP